jgi:CcmD family protein
MYDFLQNNPLYIVLIVVLMVWAGLFAYLFRIDRKLKKYER